MSLLSSRTTGPRYRALVFDLDDTLIDSRLDLVHAVNATIQHFGGTALTLAEVLSVQGGRTGLFTATLPHVIDTAVTFFGDFYRAHCLEQTTLLPGARDLLACCRAAGLPVGLLTNKYVPDARIILSGLGLLDCFSALIGGDSSFPYKPEPAGMQHILQTFRVTPDQALMVGDGLSDVGVAKRTGMDCALIDNGYASDEKLLARWAELGGALKRPPGQLRWNYPALQQFVFPDTENERK